MFAGQARSTFQRQARQSVDHWRGMEMFLNNPVAADDPCLPAVYENYWRNLAGICGIARGDGAEVVLSTVAVNLPTNARAKPARASANFQKKSWSSKMTRCSKSLGALKTRHCSIRRSPTNGEGGIRTRGPAFDRTRL